MRSYKTELVQKTLIQNYDKYYRFAYSYVHNEVDAMDVVQEAAYKAILKSDSIKNSEYIDTWICRIIINESYSVIRKNKAVGIIPEDFELEHEDSVENIDLANAIKSLKLNEQSVLILRYFQDRKLDEIAEIMDLNLNTVKSRLYRVMEKLKKILSEQEA